MTTIQWRPEVNALTVPKSYTVRYMPRAVFGYNELAAEITRDNPTCNQAMVKTILLSEREKIKEQLINGNQVTLEEGFRYRLSFHARLDEPDDPLPPVEDMLQVKISASRPFVREVRQAARLERLPSEEKLPLIVSAEDTGTELNNVLNAQGVLHLTGGNLFFDRKDPDCRCVIEGTRSGSAVQSQFALIADSEILVVPRIPAQDDPWNNEYTVSVSTRYTEHGTVRTGTFRRKLRSPLVVEGAGGPPPITVGILTGSATAPYVTITGGSLSADEMLRVQVILDLHEGHLLFSLLDMNEDGETGGVVTVTSDGAYTLSGFFGSALTGLDITVNNYADLLDMIRRDYSGRLVDVLEVRV